MYDITNYSKNSVIKKITESKQKVKAKTILYKGKGFKK
jgi:hypothetical protein